MHLGLANSSVLSTLFSLTATGLYASYFIPIFLRITISHNTFQSAEFSLGRYSLLCGYISAAWCLLMVVILCLPELSPMTVSNMNYSPLALGGVLLAALVSWICDAQHWFRGAATEPVLLVAREVGGGDDNTAATAQLAAVTGNANSNGNSEELYYQAADNMVVAEQINMLHIHQHHHEDQRFVAFKPVVDEELQQ